MDAFTQFGQALLSVCQPVSLLFMLAGVIIGIIFGSIPGLSAAMAVALAADLQHESSSWDEYARCRVYWRNFRRSYFCHLAQYAWYGFINCYLF